AGEQIVAGGDALLRLKLRREEIARAERAEEPTAVVRRGIDEARAPWTRVVGVHEVQLVSLLYARQERMGPLDRHLVPADVRDLETRIRKAESGGRALDEPETRDVVLLRPIQDDLRADA